MTRVTRAELHDRLVRAVESASVARPARVAIDGSPASGKTTLADELAPAPRAERPLESPVLVTTAPETTVRRAVARERFASSAADVERRWRERYLPAQALYAASVDPARVADIVVANDDPERPHWLPRDTGDRSNLVEHMF